MNLLYNCQLNFVHRGGDRLMKNKNITLSIIIPVYNVERYLSRCFHSVTKSPRDDIEVILVDDGSKDSSPMLCDELKANSNVQTTVIHKENGGLSSARNAGIDVAKGEYLFFLDSDDSVTEAFISDILHYLDGQRYDIIEFRCCLEKEFEKYYPKYSNRAVESNGADSLKRILTLKNGNEICFKIYRKNLFCGVRFPEGKNYEDISTCYKILMKADKILMLDSEYYIYNITNQNSITSTTSEKNMMDMFNAVNELCYGVQEYCITKGIDTDYIDYYKYHSYIYIFIKLKQNNLLKCDLAKSLDKHLKIYKKINFFKYIRYYDVKRFIYYRIMRMFN